MGGCCCCFSSSRRSDLSRRPVTPVYYYYPPGLEEHDSLSSGHVTSSALSASLLVNTNLETSIPDTYRAPPAPLPYDVDLGHSQTLAGVQDSSDDKFDPVQTTDSQPAGETINASEFGTLVTCDGLKDSDYKSQTDDAVGSPKASEVEPPKLSGHIVSATDEEDVCPTCFEEYDAENPRIITKCDHHFHLSCILEWMERSDTCPICDQEMIFNHSSYNG
eukprot:TRINITY_DN21985_c0_g1_i1.p1 TRINITY_DN21985_c0_g1~~TRINITY_DN21985_c0_g1_i1.p1  ORF type:complete len:219 (-),score=41.12 TRINITY_DN21985_c0_g1_i1:507-1163(-)